MKAWKTWLVMGVGLVAASACTLTVADGDPDGEDRDDIDIDDQQGFETDGFDDETDTDTDDVPTDTDTDDEPVTDDTPTDVDGGDMPTDDAPTDDTPTDDTPTDDMTTDDMTTDDMTTDDAGAGEMCEVTPATTCDTCMATDCTVAYTACACDEECAAGLETMLSCYAGKGYNSDNSPLECSEFDDCRAPVGIGSGSLLATLVTCIESEAQTDNMEFDRFAGDGTCTKICTGIFSITPYLDENGMCTSTDVGDAGAP